MSSGSVPLSLCPFACLAVTINVRTVAFGGCMIDRRHFRGMGNRQSLSALGDEMFYFYLLKET